MIRVKRFVSGRLGALPAALQRSCQRSNSMRNLRTTAIRIAKSTWRAVWVGIRVGTPRSRQRSDATAAFSNVPARETAARFVDPLVTSRRCRALAVERSRTRKSHETRPTVERVCRFVEGGDETPLDERIGHCLRQVADLPGLPPARIEAIGRKVTSPDEWLLVNTSARQLRVGVAGRTREDSAGSSHSTELLS